MSAYQIYFNSVFGFRLLHPSHMPSQSFNHRCHFLNNGLPGENNSRLLLYNIQHSAFNRLWQILVRYYATPAVSLNQFCILLSRCHLNVCISYNSHSLQWLLPFAVFTDWLSNGDIVCLVWGRLCQQHARLTRSSRVKCCPRQNVMLPADTFEMRKRLLTLTLAKPRYNAKAILEI
jgi:hypothetical protein